MPEQQNETSQIVVQQNGTDAMTENYKEALEKLKESSVSKAEYDKLLAENRQWAQDYVDGKLIKKSDHVEAEVVLSDKDMQKLRNDLYGPECSNLSNLEYWTKTLELRKAIIDRGGQDPFVANNAHVSGTPEDYASAQRVVDVVQDCIKQADGDSGVFTALLQSRTIDVRRR